MRVKVGGCHLITIQSGRVERTNMAVDSVAFDFQDSPNKVVWVDQPGIDGLLAATKAGNFSQAIAREAIAVVVQALAAAISSMLQTMRHRNSAFTTSRAFWNIAESASSSFAGPCLPSLLQMGIARVNPNPMNTFGGAGKCDYQLRHVPWKTVLSTVVLFDTCSHGSINSKLKNWRQFMLTLYESDGARMLCSFSCGNLPLTTY